MGDDASKPNMMMKYQGVGSMWHTSGDDISADKWQICMQCSQNTANLLRVQVALKMFDQEQSLCGA